MFETGEMRNARYVCAVYSAYRHLHADMGAKPAGGGMMEFHIPPTSWCQPKCQALYHREPGVDIPGQKFLIIYNAAGRRPGDLKSKRRKLLLLAKIIPARRTNREEVGLLGRRMMPSDAWPALSIGTSKVRIRMDGVHG